MKEKKEGKKVKIEQAEKEEEIIEQPQQQQQEDIKYETGSESNVAQSLQSGKTSESVQNTKQFIENIISRNGVISMKDITRMKKINPKILEVFQNISIKKLLKEPSTKEQQKIDIENIRDVGKILEEQKNENFLKIVKKNPREAKRKNLFGKIKLVKNEKDKGIIDLHQSTKRLTKENPYNKKNYKTSTFTNTSSFFRTV